METAKVDIRKLQLLNDRINQTIDALNQVRLSVHGIQQGGQWGAFGAGFGGQSAIGQGLGVNQFGGMLGQVPGMVPGFTHTGGYAQSPYAFQNPLLAQLWGAGVSPYAQQAVLGHLGQQSPYGVYGQQGLGLGHTSLEAYADPTIINRIAQTFPFAQWPYSPQPQLGLGMF
jgi:hypothetical protein